MTRTILEAEETTAKTKSIASSTLALVLTTAQAFYVGYHRPFTTRYFHLSVPNVEPATLSVEFWDGSAWQAVEDLVDQSSGMTQSGFISWKNPGGWAVKAQDPVDDVPLYWVRVKTDADFSDETVLQAVLNLFCDLSLLREYYPEIASDTRYLPPNRTDFLEQFHGAKNYVVQKLIQKRAIRDESQILDINEMAIASVHATVKILLSPISTTDAIKDILTQAEKDLAIELNSIRLSADLNDSGTIDETEEERSPTVFVARA